MSKFIASQYTSSQINQLTASSVSQLLTPDLLAYDLSGNTVLHDLGSAGISGLTATQIAALSSAAIQSINTGAIAALPTH